MGREIDSFDEDDFEFGDGSVDTPSPRIRQSNGQNANRPHQQNQWHNGTKEPSVYDTMQGNIQDARTETTGVENPYRGGRGSLNTQEFEEEQVQPPPQPQKPHIYTKEELKAMVNSGRITKDQAKSYMVKHGMMKPEPKPESQKVLIDPNQTYTIDVLQGYVNAGQLSADEAQAVLDRQKAAEQAQRKAKKKSKLPLVIGAVLICVVAFVVINSRDKSQVVVEDPNKFDSATFDKFLSALNNYDATAIDELVGYESGDSWIAQEWSYANLDADKEDFIKAVCGSVKFIYPQSSSESIQVTIPDYNALSSAALADAEYIRKLYKSSKYKKSDYTYHTEVYDLALYYLDQKYGTELPTTTVTCDLKAQSGIILDDSALDDLLFGSDEWHGYLDSFQKSMTGWTGMKDETYFEQERQLNPEYDEWFDIFIVYYEQDGGKYDAKTDTFSGGHFSKGKSKWEPWFKRDEKDPDKILRDENGEKIVNYFSVKKADGTDWIQPDRYIEVEVEKTRQVEDPFVPEDPIRYGYLGAHWISTHDCNYDTTIQVGDGTIEHPAGIGTTLITKLLGTDGRYHDVKVTLTGYWVGQDAIDYAVEFSDKNRGFISDSVIQLICFEYRLENLEDEDFTFESGEYCLMNNSSSKSPRTGTMYGFKQGGTLKAHEPELFNDWYASTELEQKYLCWGTSFDRKYPVLYFMVLAGDGEVPPYSAYNQFTKAKKENLTPTQTQTTDQQTQNTSQ